MKMTVIEILIILNLSLIIYHFSQRQNNKVNLSVICKADATSPWQGRESLRIAFAFYPLLELEEENFAKAKFLEKCENKFSIFLYIHFSFPPPRCQTF